MLVATDVNYKSRLRPRGSKPLSMTHNATTTCAKVSYLNGLRGRKSNKEYKRKENIKEDLEDNSLRKSIDQTSAALWASGTCQTAARGRPTTKDRCSRSAGQCGHRRCWHWVAQCSEVMDRIDCRLWCAVALVVADDGAGVDDHGPQRSVGHSLALAARLAPAV